MNTRPYVSIPMLRDTRRSLKLLSALTGMPIYRLVEKLVAAELSRVQGGEHGASREAEAVTESECDHANHNPDA